MGSSTPQQWCGLGLVHLLIFAPTLFSIRGDSQINPYTTCTKSVWNQNIIFDAVTIYKYQDESSISYKPSKKKNLIRIFKKSYEMAPLNTFYISMMMDYELCKGNVDVPSDAQKFELYSSRFSWWGDCTGCHRSRSLRNRRRDATEQHGFKMLFDGCYRSSSSTSTTGSTNPKNGTLNSVVFKLLICKE